MGGRLLGILLLCSAICCAVGDQNFVMQEAGVRVLFPPGYKFRTINMAMADFGKPLYGGTLIGKLFYPTEDTRYNPQKIKCLPVDCQYACHPFNDASPPYSIPRVPGQFNIMLVDRGPRDSDVPCYFLSKAYYAQIAGADAVLVVNDEDGDDLATAVVPDDPMSAQMLETLHISAALIRKQDGQLLKDLMEAGGDVMVALNWTNILPRSSKVSWDLWTNSNDECGGVCDEQRSFIKAMKPVAQALEKQGAATFTPHYLLWSCPGKFSDSPECVSQCIMNGTYCTPDPDDDVTKGYSGSDVLTINLYQLCFARVAKSAAQPWLWWDYADKFADTCTMASNKYNTACAQDVFISVGGPSLLGGKGTTTWQACINNVTKPAAGSTRQTIDILEQELALQHGVGSNQTRVSILPTLVIDGKQYRGTLDSAAVTRALCSAFPLDQEPSVCNERWVSEDECQPGNVGYMRCRVGDPDTGGHTRCVNTFAGYRCECGQGWVKAANSDGEEVCEDLNECLATSVRSTIADCACDRCACINLPGSFRCTGPLPNKCIPEHDYGGCWRDTVEGHFVHACADNIQEYIRMAARGNTAGYDTYTCACPGCFAPPSGVVPSQVTCEQQCPMSECVASLGVCMGQPSGSGSSPAPAGSKSNGSIAGTFFTVLLAVGVTTGGLYAVYHFVLKQRMQDEIRDIMSQYMPLGGAGGGSGGGAGGASGARPAATFKSPGRNSRLQPIEEEVSPLLSPGSVPLEPSAFPAAAGATGAGTSAASSSSGGLAAAAKAPTFGPAAGAPATELSRDVVNDDPTASLLSSALTSPTASSAPFRQQQAAAAPAAPAAPPDADAQLLLVPEQPEKRPEVIGDGPL